MEEKKSHESVRAVERALEILLAFRPGDKELAVAELLTRVDLSRPTLYRLLNTLEQQGFLVSSGEPQRFRLIEHRVEHAPPLGEAGALRGDAADLRTEETFKDATRVVLRRQGHAVSGKGERGRIQRTPGAGADR